MKSKAWTSFAKGPDPDRCSRQSCVDAVLSRGLCSLILAAFLLASGQHRADIALVRLATAVLTALCAGMLSASRCSMGTCQLITALLNMTWATSNWVGRFSFVLLREDPAIGTEMRFAVLSGGLAIILECLSPGLDRRSQTVCIAWQVANIAVYAMLAGAEVADVVRATMMPSSPCLISILLLASRCQQRYAQADAEQQATSALMRMVSDAHFWLSANGDTIIESDAHLDAMMGAAMEGRSFTGCLTDGDKRRLRLAVAAPKDSASLVPVAIRRPGAKPLRAELFVVGAGADAQSRFFVGLRLAEPCEPLPDAACATPSSSSPRGSPRASPRAAAVASWGDAAGPQGGGFGAAVPDRAAGSPRRNGLRLASTVPTSPVSLEGKSDLEAAASQTASPVSDSGSLPSLLQEPVEVRPCRREDLARVLSSHAQSPIRSFGETLRQAVDLICDHARGGALLLLAEKQAFADVFAHKGAPVCRASDGGYMTARLRGVHIGDARFAAAFREFTEPSDTDRWPEDYGDAAARNLPKDGAFLIDARGFRVKCAAKVLGLRPPRCWHGVGTKHEAALACTWAVDRCVALVRSDGGGVHAIARDGADLFVYRIRP